jgi:hypothetical protein
MAAVRNASFASLLCFHLSSSFFTDRSFEQLPFVSYQRKLRSNLIIARDKKFCAFEKGHRGLLVRVCNHQIGIEGNR